MEPHYKFSNKGCRIWIKLNRVAFTKGEQISISVRDNGKGINPDFLPIMFDRFTQADSSSTRAYGGLGLGLSIVRNLVEMQGGTVTVESPGEGKGATFTICFPLEHNTKANVGP